MRKTKKRCGSSFAQVWAWSLSSLLVFWATTWDQPLTLGPLYSRPPWSDCPSTWREQGWPQGLVKSTTPYCWAESYLYQKTEKAVYLLTFSLKDPCPHNLSLMAVSPVIPESYQLQYSLRITDTFCFGTLASGLGFVLLCDNYNLNPFPFPLCKASTVSRWLVYALVHYIWQ